MAVWYDFTQAGAPAAVQSLGAKLLRFPGGSASDQYHWQTNSECNGGYVAPNTSFDSFINNVVKPGGFDVAITLNYGSNATCNGGGDPTEAAAWVAHAKTLGLTGLHWTVGNENFGSWEYDLHTAKNDPTTYASAVAGTNGYYALVKAEDPTAKVGVVVNGSWALDPTGVWDTTVLAHANYDYVELHYYAQNPGSESDTWLLKSAPADLSAQIAKVKAELVAIGKPNIPIYLGEYNSATNAGKQSVSIVGGLFTAMALGEVLNDGVPMATQWMGIGAGCSTTANNSASLYGWQTFGSLGLMADPWPDSGDCTGFSTIPLGTKMPSGNTMTLVSKFAVAGNQMLPVTVPSTLTSVKAYAATQGTGYALMLFNLDQTNAVTVNVQMASTSATQFTATSYTYGKLQYDDSKNNVWTGPVTSSLGTTTTTPTVILPPWSMVVVQLTR